VYDVLHVNAEFAQRASDHDPQWSASSSDDLPSMDAGGRHVVQQPRRGSVFGGMAGVFPVRFCP
jgi:hypothetical protein